MQIHAEPDLIANHIRGAASTNTPIRVGVLILQLIIHKYIQGAAERVRHIHTREPIAVSLRRRGGGPHRESIVP